MRGGGDWKELWGEVSKVLLGYFVLCFYIVVQHFAASKHSLNW